MKILVVEDDKRVASFICKGLREERYTVDHAKDGAEGEFMAQNNPYNLIILDLMLPQKSGHEVLKSLRKSGCKTPVLILTAKDKIEDKVEEFHAGADDYLTKPFAYEELLVRVQALLRRGAELRPEILKLADLKIDTTRHIVTRAGKRIELTNREYGILEYLMRHTGRIVTRTLLSEHVWEQSFDSFSNVVDVHIARLRKKIDDGFSPKLLQTLRGTGYMLQIPEET